MHIFRINICVYFGGQHKQIHILSSLYCCVGFCFVSNSQEIGLEEHPEMAYFMSIGMCKNLS